MFKIHLFSSKIQTNFKLYEPSSNINQLASYRIPQLQRYRNTTRLATLVKLRGLLKANEPLATFAPFGSFTSFLTPYNLYPFSLFLATKRCPFATRHQNFHNYKLSTVGERRNFWALFFSQSNVWVPCPLYCCIFFHSQQTNHVPSRQAVPQKKYSPQRTNKL